MLHGILRRGIHDRTRRRLEGNIKTDLAEGVFGGVDHILLDYRGPRRPIRLNTVMICRIA
jgi:hypothetical protein